MKNFTYRDHEALILIALTLLLASCSSSRFVPEDKTLLSDVKMISADKQVRTSAYRTYVQQEANLRWFSLIKVPLGIYCISGTDSTKRINRFFRRIGEAPVIYDEALTEHSRHSIEQALQSHGFLHARVSTDTTVKNRRTHLTYHLMPGRQTFVEAIHHDFDNPDIEQIVMADSASSLLKKGMPLDATQLEEERKRITKMLQDKGFYSLHKEFVTFVVDTIAGSHTAHLTLKFSLPAGADSLRAYRPYRLRNVTVLEDVLTNEAADTTCYNGLRILYKDKPHLYRKIYADNIYFRPGSLYSDRYTALTYRDISSLAPVSFSSVRYSIADTEEQQLDADIHVRLNKPHTIGLELEGTNTAGDLGAAASVTYSNRNLLRGAESLSLKLRGAYEAITGLEGYSNQNYIEYSAEVSLRFPSIKIPMKAERRRNLKGSTDFSMMYNSQNRPEFHRRVLTATWSYLWNRHRDRRWSNRFDLLSLNYVFMPWISDTFRKNYLEGDDPRYSLLRYTYENTFIMRMGYSFTYNSRRNAASSAPYQSNGFQIRFNIETAGNLLYAFSKMTNGSKDADGHYNVFNVPYSQYVKADLDFSKSVILGETNSLAFHAAAGIALPYGNASVIPYEKRYFSGGANSVRGWSVRELGPGSFVGQDGKVDFINQTGNMKFDLSVEYRTILFWKLHGAAFIDAGNIWNTRNYIDQPGGQFKLNTFYKQIAASYGLGLRLNFDYFVLRFDGGMKAINPAIPSGSGHYPLLHPRFGRDFAFHFAVGLPF